MVPLPEFLHQLGQWHRQIDTVLVGNERGYAHHPASGAHQFGVDGWNPKFTSWFQAQFVDAHHWVMQTNVLGMGLWADAGRLGSKPYAASGRYINKMSTYCKGCRFDQTKRSGPGTRSMSSIGISWRATRAVSLAPRAGSDDPPARSDRHIRAGSDQIPGARA